MTAGLHFCTPDASSCRGETATDEPVGRVRRVEAGGIRPVGGECGPVWPIVLARNDVGVGDTILGRGGEADILGQLSYENMPISGCIGQLQ